ncbi:aspartate 1-decarboxylase [Alienimonas californiensis]|uniref:Aspartate 1-decarboxylase n=1 Tax=Alienimonas californiensis TaxID=2527989 RepID=A0A517PA61_9PLAN|nr:aspartate 1-decarboxylase [Alienimonas californiensis]QDT16252.1 Aspartate 1-decarboxylase precursor [Alienimonas californiensis]
MRRTLLNAKIHRATVTDADLHYEGSLTIDVALLEAADILPHERVEVYNVTRGTRFATYAIPGPAGRGDICANGAAAHLAVTGDLVIVCTYAEFEEAEARAHHPTVVLVDERNRARQSLDTSPSEAGVVDGHHHL